MGLIAHIIDAEQRLGANLPLQGQHVLLGVGNTCCWSYSPVLC
jgi:hypothetical protein